MGHSPNSRLWYELGIDGLTRMAKENPKPDEPLCLTADFEMPSANSLDEYLTFFFREIIIGRLYPQWSDDFGNSNILKSNQSYSIEVTSPYTEIPKAVPRERLADFLIKNVKIALTYPDFSHCFLFPNGHSQRYSFPAENISPQQKIVLNPQTPRAQQPKRNGGYTNNISPERLREFRSKHAR